MTEFDVVGDSVLVRVETLRRYTNLPGLSDDLARTQACLAASTADGRERPSLLTSSRGPARFTLSQLTGAQGRTMTSRFVAGTSKQVLAKEFGISLSSVKRILRQHRGDG